MMGKIAVAKCFTMIAHLPQHIWSALLIEHHILKVPFNDNNNDYYYHYYYYHIITIIIIITFFKFLVHFYSVACKVNAGTVEHIICNYACF